VFEVFKLCASGEIGGGEYCSKRIHKASSGGKGGFLEKHYTRLLWLDMNIIMWDTLITWDLPVTLAGDLKAHFQESTSSCMVASYISPSACLWLYS